MCAIFSDVPNEVTPENPYMIPNKREDLLPPSEGMHDVLFVIVNSNSRFIKEVRLHAPIYVHVSHNNGRDFRTQYTCTVYYGTLFLLCSICTLQRLFCWTMYTLRALYTCTCTVYLILYAVYYNVLSFFECHLYMNTIEDI